MAPEAGDVASEAGGVASEDERSQSQERRARRAVGEDPTRARSRVDVDRRQRRSIFWGALKERLIQSDSLERQVHQTRRRRAKDGDARRTLRREAQTRRRRGRLGPQRRE